MFRLVIECLKELITLKIITKYGNMKNIDENYQKKGEQKNKQKATYLGVNKIE